MTAPRWSVGIPGGGYVDDRSRAVVDPYLAWADATAFGDHRRAEDGLPTRLPVLVELAAGVTAAALAQALPGEIEVTPVYRGRSDLRHCTAQFSAQACRQLAVPGNPWVTRFELAAPVLPRRAPRRPPAVLPAPRREPPLKSAGATLLAVIDHGCPFAHAAFQHGGVPRVLSLWDQDAQPAFGSADLPGEVPADFGYGREVCRAELAALMGRCRDATGSVNEDLCYERARYPELRRGATHGAHVMDQFIGPRRLGDRMLLAGDDSPGWRADGRRASDSADLVFVQLPTDAWSDPNALALAARVLDGLHHVLSCKGGQVRRVVVNLSAGVPTGPHDGSTLLDAALQELVDAEHQRGCELRIVVPAGNTAQDRWHAAGTLDGSTPGVLRWRVPPGCEAPGFLQVWLGADAPPGLRWSVQAPGDAAPVPIPESGLCRRHGAAVQALALPSDSRARGGRGRWFFLAVAAAALPDEPGAAGDWLLRIDLPPGAAALPVRAWVGRNQSELGAPERHRPSRLIDADYDPQRHLRARLHDPQTMAPRGLQVQRAGTASALAAASAVTAVAGLQLGPRPGPADYSAQGLDDRRSVAGVSDESRALSGIRGAGTRSGGVVRLRGTSFAAPQWARELADQRLPRPKTGPATAPAALPAPEQPWPQPKGQRGGRLGRGLVLPRLRPGPLPDLAAAVLTPDEPEPVPAEAGAPAPLSPR